MISPNIDLDRLTERIIGCAIEVHRVLGPGLLESVYRDCLVVELKRAALSFETDRRLRFDYKGVRIGGGLRLDFLVSDCVVVELKAIERLHSIHSQQVITYLKIGEYPIGLLMNFNATTLRAGLKRLEHPDFYAQKRRAKLLPS